MSNDISLSSATRTNLLSLNKTTSLINRTQERLATGKDVNSAIDDALSFFNSRALSNRASDFSEVKDKIANGIQVLTATTDALASVEDIMKQMKAIASSAKSTSANDTATRTKLLGQYNELRTQIDHLVSDASYNGTNLIKSGADTLTVNFTEDSSADPKRTLTIAGVASDASGLGISSAADWADTAAFAATIEEDIGEINTALVTVRTTAQTFGTNASMLQIREEFTNNIVSTLEGGAADLVNADLNKESANMLSLQTRQSLGTISLSIAQQSEQSILRLF